MVIREGVKKNVFFWEISPKSVYPLTSGETLCRDNRQLIGMPFFYTRSAGKNNRN